MFVILILRSLLLLLPILADKSHNAAFVSLDCQAWWDQVESRSWELFRICETNNNDNNEAQQHPLQYSIFQEGRSVLRDIPPKSKWISRLPPLIQSDKLLLAISMLMWMYHDGQRRAPNDYFHLDAAHEILLGVTQDNIAEAEYAATHRGQTPWAKQHPLTDEDDMLHAIIHRLEGNNIGEGGYSGWDNAKYWTAGGPKRQGLLGCHPVHYALSRLCKQRLSKSDTSSVLIDDAQSRQHEVIAGGGETRWVTVERGCWDPIAWIELCQSQFNNQLPPCWRKEDVRELQVAELCLLTRWQLHKILGASRTDIWPDQ